MDTGKPRSRREDDIKADVKEIERESVDCSKLAPVNTLMTILFP
jgi:hypothetical protein